VPLSRRMASRMIARVAGTAHAKRRTEAWRMREGGPQSGKPQNGKTKRPAPRIGSGPFKPPASAFKLCRSPSSARNNQPRGARGFAGDDMGGAESAVLHDERNMD